MVLVIDVIKYWAERGTIPLTRWNKQLLFLSERWRWYWLSAPEPKHRTLLHGSLGSLRSFIFPGWACVICSSSKWWGAVFLAKWKMEINYVQTFNSAKPSITRRRHVPISSVVPLEIFLLNVCAYFPWPLIFELQLAPMQNMKHFKLHNAD